ncbi:MAG: RNA polymerase sigma factor [Saprospiraceae bacterium]
MTVEPHPDSKYIEALCKGDSQLIDEIYRRFSQPLLRWTLANNGKATDAEDLFQEALMAIYERYCHKEFRLTCSLGSLIMAICKRKWYDKLHHKKRESDVRNTEARRYEEEQESSAMEEAEAVAENEQRQFRLSQSFRQLSAQCQKLLTLLGKGQTDAAILAEALELPNANALYQARHRCISRWKQLYYQIANA